MESFWVKAKAYNFAALSESVKDIVYQGYPMGTILSQLFDDLIEMKDISDLNKALICEKIAEVSFLIHLPGIDTNLANKFFLRRNRI